MEDNEKHIRKILEGEGTQDASNKELKLIEEIADYTGHLQVPKGKSKEAMWNDVLNKIDQREKKPIKQPIFWAAASLVILVVSYFFFYHSNTNISTGNGEMLTINLPNGSVVLLSAGSSIEYNENKWEDERIIQLTGQARFEVTKGNLFKVISDKGKVTVFGTIFDVIDRNDNYQVSCLSGQVEVQKEKQKEILTKGQRVVVKNGQFSVLETDFEQMTNWTKGEFYFDGKPLGLVLDELERQFDIKIARPEQINKRTYHGYFVNKNLNDALQLVLSPMNLSYQVIGKEVHITL